MYVEHVAFLVDDPQAVADWYCAQLGMRVARAGDAPNHARFLVDAAGKAMFEIYTSETLTTPDYGSMHHSVLHLAFFSDDVEADCERLISAGASWVNKPEANDAGDTMAMMRDPWGLALQVLKRKVPML